MILISNKLIRDTGYCKTTFKILLAKLNTSKSDVNEETRVSTDTFNKDKDMNEGENNKILKQS